MKFDGYTINFKTITKKTLSNGDIYAVAELKGNIEIGIDIDKWSWRGDWIAEKVLKEKKNDYRLEEVVNAYLTTIPVEINRVELIFKHR